MRLPAAFVIGYAVLLPVLAVADTSDDTLEYYLGRSDLVVIGKIADNPARIVHEDGVSSCMCEFSVDDVLKGDGTLAATTIKVNIVRFKGDEKDRHPLIKNGGACILFLKKQPDGTLPQWQTADFWFGVQHPFPWLAASLKRVAKEMVKRVP